MSISFWAAGTVSTIFALAATPATLLPALAIGGVAGVCGIIGNKVGKVGAGLLGAATGGVAAAALTKDGGAAVGGAGCLGIVSYALGAFVGPIVGGTLGYQAASTYFNEEAEVKDNETSQVIQDTSRLEIPYEKTEDGNYILPAKKALTLTA
tara:strand:+ start:533332 stop:533787 length:456 start_codon:yes stop_codon:yes gene_type:complete